MLTPTTMTVLVLLCASAAPAAARQAQPSAPQTYDTPQQQSAPPASNARQGAPSSLRWYDAYNEGVAAVRAGDWKRAEAMLLAARERHPEQGREVFYYGQTYRPFVPDFYLAQVYLNTGRAAEALTTLGTVRRANLADEKDAAFRDTLGRAQDAVVAQARRDVMSDRRAEVERLVSALRAAGADTGLIGEFQPYLDGAKTASANPPPPSLPSTSVPSTSQVLAGSQIGGASTGLVLPGTVAPYRPPSGSRPIGDTTNSGLGLPANIGQRRSTFGNSTGTVGTSTSVGTLDWSRGLRAFLAGDYPAAAALLASGDDPGAPSRVRLYLACARVGQVLVGQGEAALLKAARQTYRSANLSAAIGAQDARYISPRILAQLEAR